MSALFDNSSMEVVSSDTVFATCSVQVAVLVSFTTLQFRRFEIATMTGLFCSSFKVSEVAALVAVAVD